MIDQEKTIVLERDYGEVIVKIDEDASDCTIVTKYDGGYEDPPGYSDVILSRIEAVEVAKFILKNFTFYMDLLGVT